jgi:HD-GYP domain-containing protein (c-di-GMP phosphodiesterase class II)
MSTPQQLDAATERRIEDSLERRRRALDRRERRVETGFAVATLAAAVALALLAEPARAFSLPLAMAMVAAYALAAHVEFVFGDSRTVPTQLVFVPMLLLLPTPLVPLLAAASLVARPAAAALRRRAAPHRVIFAVGDMSFALAPALVLVLLDAQSPHWAHVPAYLLAFSAQWLCDGALAAVRLGLALGTPWRRVARELSEVYKVDALLTPVGLLVAIAAAPHPATALLILPLVFLFKTFAREREGRIAQSIEMTRSFRGTALLLRDLLEEDDEYTGHHTEDVVDLSVRVAESLGVSEQIRRETELGALLHDIGKIHIPDAIINKPGKLDDAEWTIMQTHTIEGQRMLDQVGGLLTSVGFVVRASHERYDGGGYPDGLAGEGIPLAARIVAACDSFNAMTTTRSYRKALPVSHAVDELRRCSGTQFDPAVIDALLAVVGDPGWTASLREAPAPAVATAPAGTVAR